MTCNTGLQNMFVENNERMHDERKEEKKENVIKGDKWIFMLFSRSSPLPGSHSILLLTRLPALAPSLQCFFPSPFWHKILRPSLFSLPGWVFSAHETFIDLFLCAILLHAFVSVQHLIVSYSAILLHPDFIAPQGWKLCHIYFACLPSLPLPRCPLKHRSIWQIFAEWLNPFSMSSAKV